MYIYKQLESNDISVTPFQVYKQWDFTNINASSSYGIINYYGEYKNTPVNLGDPSDISHFYPTTSFNEYDFLIHDSINHLYYNNFEDDPLSLFGNINKNQKRELHEFVWVLSIPQKMYGERINPNSFYLDTKSVSGSIINLKDDGYGKIVDIHISESYKSYYDTFSEGVVGNWEFTNGYKLQDEWLTDRYTRDYSMYKHHGKLNNVRFSTGSFITGSNIIIKEKTDFNGTDSYVRIQHNKEWNFRRNDDFMIMCSLQISNSSQTGSIIFSKNGKLSDVINDNAIYTPNNYYDGRYPFQLEILSNNISGSILRASIYDGFNLSSVDSQLIPLQSDANRFIVINKSGSNFDLWCEAVKTTGSIKTNSEVTNYSDLFLGSLGGKSNYFSGSINFLTIYNRGFKDSDIFNYAQGLYNYDYKVGNIFYEYGLVTLTQPYLKNYLEIVGSNSHRLETNKY